MQTTLANGVAVGVGFAGGVSAFTLTSGAVLTGRLLLQSADSSQDAENVEVYDDTGFLVGSYWINFLQKAALKLTLKSNVGLTDFLAQTEAVVESLTPGLLVTMTIPSMPSLNGTNWELLSGAKVSGTNKTAKEWTIDVRKSPGITAVTSA
jgi:hypothetical protein